MNQKSANKTKSKPPRKRTADWDAALRLLKKKRLMTHAEFATMGISGVKLRRSAEAGQVLSLGSGIYADASIGRFTASVWAISKYYPDAVISGFTALNIHRLSNEFIEKIDADIPRSASIRNKLLKVHRVAEKRITGVIRHKYEGVPIRIYNIERSLCELIVWIRLAHCFSALSNATLRSETSEFRKFKNTTSLPTPEFSFT